MWNVTRPPVAGATVKLSDSRGFRGALLPRLHSVILPRTEANHPGEMGRFGGEAVRFGAKQVRSQTPGNTGPSVACYRDSVAAAGSNATETRPTSLAREGCLSPRRHNGADAPGSTLARHRVAARALARIAPGQGAAFVICRRFGRAINLPTAGRLVRLDIATEEEVSHRSAAARRDVSGGQGKVRSRRRSRRARSTSCGPIYERGRRSWLSVSCWRHRLRRQPPATIITTIGGLRHLGRSCSSSWPHTAGAPCKHSTSGTCSGASPARHPAISTCRPRTASAGALASSATSAARSDPSPSTATSAATTTPSVAKKPLTSTTSCNTATGRRSERGGTRRQTAGTSDQHHQAAALSCGASSAAAVGGAA